MNEPISDVIVSTWDDYHAVAVLWALRHQGRSPMIWDGLGKAEGSLSFDISGVDNTLRLNKNEIASLRSLWIRRPRPYKPLENVAPFARKFLDRELKDAHRAICTEMERVSDFVICSETTERSYRKTVQLQIAKEVGFNVPATIISNDFKEVERFCSKGPTVVKHFAPHLFWSADQNDVKAVVTSDVGDLKQVDVESIEVAPAIYQEKIDKAYEVRLTVIGSKLFAAKILAEDGFAFLDWRLDIGKENCKLEACTLSDELEICSLRLMKKMGLAYGCIDLAVSRVELFTFWKLTHRVSSYLFSTFYRSYNY